MVTVHFLHVDPGACSIIEHDSGRTTVIDVCNGRDPKECSQGRGTFESKSDLCVVNPIQYLYDLGVDDDFIFRFIATHPHMDHLDGIKDVFEKFEVLNFWDTKNDKKDDDFSDGRYREEDWKFYKDLRDEKSSYNLTRLVLNSGARACYYNEPDEKGKSHDSLYIMAPEKCLAATANQEEEYNDLSYVILHESEGRKVLFCGDSHDNTWDYILRTCPDEVKDVDLMIAPHHGRDSDRKYKFLETTNPKLSLFGCVDKKDRADSNWRNKNGDLKFIAVDDVGSVTVTIDGSEMKVYVANRESAKSKNGSDGYDGELDACFYCKI